MPPTEAPPPPPPPEAEMEENSKNLAKNDNDFIDKQEQEIIASLEKEEREHKKYMDTVNAMRALSPSSSGWFFIEIFGPFLSLFCPFWIHFLPQKSFS